MYILGILCTTWIECFQEQSQREGERGREGRGFLHITAEICFKIGSDRLRESCFLKQESEVQLSARAVLPFSNPLCHSTQLEAHLYFCLSLLASSPPQLGREIK